MKVFSIDPGYGRIGFAILEKGNRTTPTVIHSECLETDKTLLFENRLMKIGERIRELIHEHKPNCVVLERLFFSKNKKTALQTAEVRGVCIHESKLMSLDIFEYTPNQVKSAITGSGSADKKQIMRMVPMLADMEQKENTKDDEFDAIAIGITHIATSRRLSN